ncbi:hypothetical protein ACFYYR_31280 [Streptomyces sp. NPDC001922]|uniref:hypothetical protein n=1 Tax=Streptomyces sp. NPDC001922 TaxID=3364624 RepID=UPI00368EB738
MTELSGVDVARQGLVAAREAAKMNGGVRITKPSRHAGHGCATRRPRAIQHALAALLLRSVSPQG